jgi:predicted RNA-binding Zn-ribbon protein involved in translation (DUF1610 family)
MAFVTIRIKGAEGYTRSDLDKDRLVVGRASASGLPIKHTSISREHFALVRGEIDGAERWFVEDLGSANGTRINDQLVTGRVALLEKDIIKAGRARLTYHDGTVAEAAAAIEVSAGDDDGGPSGPVRKVGAEDPPEATACGDCAGWFSIAHRLSGESMPCPHCGKTQIVPELVT